MTKPSSFPCRYEPVANIYDILSPSSPILSLLFFLSVEEGHMHYAKLSLQRT